MVSIPLLISILLLAAGCATYTTETGYSRIVLPEEEPLPETKLSLIRGNDAAAAAAVTEEESSAEAEALPAIEEEKAEDTAPAVYEKDKENLYPAALSLIKFPHLYTPADSDIVIDGGVADVSIAVLPLGFGDMEAADFSTMLDALADVSPDFIALTGSLANQVLAARNAGWDAVTLRGGTLLFRPRFLSSDGSTAKFMISSDKDIEIAILSMDDRMPAESSGIGEWLEGIDRESDRSAKSALDAVSGVTDREAVYIISSPEPSTDDWIALTPYRYRYDRHFGISDTLKAAGWKDAYTATHFSAETDGGITRHEGDVYERLDFVYIKGLMPEKAVSFAVEGLTDRTGNSALLADLIIP